MATATPDERSPQRRAQDEQIANVLTDLCIYTIRQSEELRAVAASDRRATYSEGKRWSWAKRIVDAGRRTGARVPIIFAPAEATRYLIAWALLDEVTLDEKTTLYTFSQLQLFTKRRRKTTLRKARNGEPLHQMFIRPYSICRTPGYLED